MADGVHCAAGMMLLALSSYRPRSELVEAALGELVVRSVEGEQEFGILNGSRLLQFSFRIDR